MQIVRIWEFSIRSLWMVGDADRPRGRKRSNLSRGASIPEPRRSASERSRRVVRPVRPLTPEDEFWVARFAGRHAYRVANGGICDLLNCAEPP